MRLRLSILAALTFAVALSSAAVSAAPASASRGTASFALVPQHYDPGLGATQSYFVAVAHPGETFTNSVRVRNLGTQTGTALLYAVDATTGQTSGAVYLDRSNPRPGVGGWVRLGADSVTLAPGESRVVPITVHVPAGASPGDHLGGIVAENAEVQSSSGKGSLQIRVRHLTIAAVLVQVPGPAAATVALTGARAGGEHGYQYVYLQLRNTGALATKPEGRLEVFDASGKRVASRTFRLDTVVPRTAIDYPVLLPRQALPAGAYRADVQLRYAAATIGYRSSAGPQRIVRRSFDFAVSQKQYGALFQGTRPAPTPSQSMSRSSSPTPSILLAAAVALLCAIGVTGFVLVRQRP
jgi:hypothetical protein